jgi:hypothetical protein
MGSSANRFVVGGIMLVVGGYLFLNAVQVNQFFGMQYHIMYMGNTSITSGYVMVPFIFGIGMLFYNYKNPIAWILTFGSLGLLIFGIITSLQFNLRSMTAFELVTILILMVGGLGLFLSSFRGNAS